MESGGAATDTHTPTPDWLGGWDPSTTAATTLASHVANSTEDGSREIQSPISVNGGFIAMAAGLSVIVPLVCILVIQLRKAKREERERRLAQERGGGEEGSGTEGLNDPPPTYEQLFGPGFEPVHSRSNSTDVLIEDETSVEEGRVGVGRINHVGMEGGEDVSVRVEESERGREEEEERRGGGEGDGGETGLGNAPSTTSLQESSISMISGREVADYSLTGQTTTSGGGAPVQGQVYLSVAQLPALTTAATVSTTTTTTTTSARANSNIQGGANPSSTPPPPPPPGAPPPFRDTRSISSPPTSNENTRPAPRDGQQSDNQTRPPFMQRRFPGMHISLHDLFQSLRSHDNEPEVPPPSYEEALKILESAKLAKESGNSVNGGGQNENQRK